MTTAWVFPGQGSQAVGMGGDLGTTPVGKDRFEEAKNILGWSVLDKCQGDETELAKTLYTQPCLYVVESILIDLLKDKGQQPDLVAGHSLGEYSALYAAEVFDFATGLKLVKRRAELMSEAAGGKMVALMKFDRSQLEEAIAGTPDVVLANDNSEQQVVISGTPEAVDQLCSQVKTKRAIPLKVSGAFHSPMMAAAAPGYAFSGIDLCDDERVGIYLEDHYFDRSDAAVVFKRLDHYTGDVRYLYHGNDGTSMPWNDTAQLNYLNP